MSLHKRIYHKSFLDNFSLFPAFSGMVGPISHMLISSVKSSQPHPWPCLQTTFSGWVLLCLAVSYSVHHPHSFYYKQQSHTLQIILNIQVHCLYFLFPPKHYTQFSQVSCHFLTSFSSESKYIIFFSETSPGACEMSIFPQPFCS